MADSEGAPEGSGMSLAEVLGASSAARHLCRPAVCLTRPCLWLRHLQLVTPWKWLSLNPSGPSWQR